MKLAIVVFIFVRLMSQQLGFQGALQTNSVKSDDPMHRTQGTESYLLGGILRFEINHLSSIDLEINYDKRSFNVKDSYKTFRNESYHFYYLSLIPKYRYKIIDDFSIEFGPSIAKRIHAELIEETVKHDINETINTWSYSIVSSISYNYSIRYNEYQVFAAYDFGLSNVDAKHPEENDRISALRVGLRIIFF